MLPLSYVELQGSGLGESIDFSRQAQAQVAPPADLLILRVTPTDKAPPAPYKVPGTDNLNTITK